MKTRDNLTRRQFINHTAASGLAFSILPASVWSRAGGVGANDKINVALVGCGTQGLGQLEGWLRRPELQFVAACDPNRESRDYPLWGQSQGATEGAPGGREVGRRRINEFYTQQSGQARNDCKAYADFRELLEKEQDLDAVFIMTPDHLHATIAVAAMKKNVRVGSHKPIGNFMQETRVACETARRTGVSTQLFAWQDHKENYIVSEWLRQGLIGRVKELHRWTNRPVWPQGSPYLPTRTPPIPEGFDWELWLGPALPRTYSPDYTHTVFRGWYEFGGGCLADMGYYGFWVDWRVLNLGMPTVAEASSSHTCEIRDFRSSKVENHLSYPHAATLRWEVPVNGTKDLIDVYWYEGGIRPKTPKDLIAKGKSLPREGVMFVGEEGSILANYGYNDLQVFGVKEGDPLAASIKIPEVELLDATSEMIDSFRGGKPSRGSYINAQTVAEAICVGNLAIRMDQRLEWDNQEMRVTNAPEANQYVSRQYRPGWEIR